MDEVRVVVCMDSWKGSLDAETACGAVAEGLRAAVPGIQCDLCPLADGGEGTLDLVARTRPGERVVEEVAGPFADRRLRAPFLLWPGEREALVEMAVCAGLPLLSEAERDPLPATTFGVGELMRSAAGRGAKRIFLAVGGSATVDGGTGMASALGWRFLDAEGRELSPGGGALERLARIEPPERPAGFEVEVLCDVTNPLLGERGAAPVFAPQKGADAEAVARLERGLARLAEVLQARGIAGVGDLPGGGAAGGMAAGAAAFFGARLVSGVKTVMDFADLDGRLAAADWVVTGEGRLDDQSLDGKVVSGVLERARSRGARVAVVAGSCALTEKTRRTAGIEHALSANHGDLPLEQALREAGRLARGAGERLGMLLSN